MHSKSDLSATQELSVPSAIFTTPKQIKIHKINNDNEEKKTLCYFGIVCLNGK